MRRRNQVLLLKHGLMQLAFLACLGWVLVCLGVPGPTLRRPETGWFVHMRTRADILIF